MKHRFRFFAQQTKNESGYSWSITGEELRHLSILRLSPGDSIEVFDGKGSYSFGIIESLKPKKEALVQSKEIHFEEKPKKSLSLAIGALKPKTFEDLLPCLVELGLDSIHVFTQQHTEKFRLSEKNKERWNKIIVSSTKQSKRNYLADLQLWTKKSDFEKHMTKNYDKIFVLDPKAKENLIEEKSTEESICAVIGSESGLSDEELSFLKTAGAKPVSLGKHILRAYTAAIATTTLLVSASRIK